MKQKIVIFAVVAMILVAIAACSKDELGVEVIVPQQEQMDSYRVSVDEALRSAETILRAGDRDTRSAARRVKSAELYVAKPATRSNENTEVSFYLINYDDNAGYALVSTDERTTPVYMYAEEGNITTEAFEEVPPLAIFMEEAIANYEAEVASYGADEPIDIYFPPGVSGKIATIDGIECYLDIHTTQVSKGPFCSSTIWHQDFPYNIYCNNHFVGCGMIAMGQIMAYHKYPAAHGTSTYNWNNILSDTTFYYGYQVGVTDVARLLRDIGDAAGANYTDNDPSTGITIDDAKQALNAFDYTCSSPTDFNQQTAVLELNAHRPIYARGQISTTGHAWVIDGYDRYFHSYVYRYTTPPYNIYKTVSSEDLYFSHNTGNYGYYSHSGQFHPIGIYYALSTMGQFEEYPDRKRMITNIQPNN
ncbi:MAG: C10 family peptidase [Alistipes sp.]|nr:C10 family peptidase [Alistipes sp.]